MTTIEQPVAAKAQIGRFLLSATSNDGNLSAEVTVDIVEPGNRLKTELRLKPRK